MNMHKQLHVQPIGQCQVFSLQLSHPWFDAFCFLFLRQGPSLTLKAQGIQSFPPFPKTGIPGRRYHAQM